MGSGARTKARCMQEVRASCGIDHYPQSYEMPLLPRINRSGESMSSSQIFVLATASIQSTQ
jgi:hypothetical protein